MRIERYAVIIEKAGENYSAYVPHLPGLNATGATLEETESEIREAIRFQIDGLKEDCLPVPDAVSRLEYVDAQSFRKRSIPRFRSSIACCSIANVSDLIGWGEA
ncbi:type II toxin-antitoxin system HicB family antitoxin [Tianweitania sediminis]|uniref:Type II toxin-antitoxin system HicB family antitoxin n=1 Tax=Tianweitania sediminis TaxID=1502156 RepID=A0A8J7UJC4_9HYPH|nr:type II toxin-antitoxin system HicB family antitoxin [Tianweitania sediminis]